MKVKLKLSFKVTVF